MGQVDIVGVALGIGPLICCVWLPFRWFRYRPAPDRWLGIAAFAPLVAVVLHWWNYRSDSVLAHLWIAAIQLLAFLATIRLSSSYVAKSGAVSRQDHLASVLMAGLAGFCTMVFIVLFGEDGGTLQIVAPAFSADPPRVWSILSGHQWPAWLVSAGGLLGSAVVTRRNPAVGYLGFATIVTLMALDHWFSYRLGYETLGAGAPTVSSLVVIAALAGLSWFIAGRRLLIGNHT